MTREAPRPVAPIRLEGIRYESGVFGLACGAINKHKRLVSVGTERGERFVPDVDYRHVTAA